MNYIDTEATNKMLIWLECCLRNISNVAFLVTTLNYDILSDMSELETLHDRGSRELANFIIDLEDEECPKFQLHLAAYQGDIPQMKALLQQDDFQMVIFG